MRVTPGQIGRRIRGREDKSVRKIEKFANLIWFQKGAFILDLCFETTYVSNFNIYKTFLLFYLAQVHHFCELHCPGH
jgi:hypothetical protein